MKMQNIFANNESPAAILRQTMTVSLSDDGMIDPTITGCFRKP